MELGRGVNTGTVTNKSNSLLQLPSFSYVLRFLTSMNTAKGHLQQDHIPEFR